MAMGGAAASNATEEGVKLGLDRGTGAGGGAAPATGAASAADAADATGGTEGTEHNLSWSKEEDEALVEQYMLAFDLEDEDDDWQAIADALGGRRSKKSCKARFKRLIKNDPVLCQELEERVLDAACPQPAGHLRKASETLSSFVGGLTGGSGGGKENDGGKENRRGRGGGGGGGSSSRHETEVDEVEDLLVNLTVEESVATMDADLGDHEIEALAQLDLSAVDLTEDKPPPPNTEDPQPKAAANDPPPPKTEDPQPATSWTKEEEDALVEQYMLAFDLEAEDDDWQAIADALGAKRSTKAYKTRFKRLLTNNPELCQELEERILAGAGATAGPSLGERVIFEKLQRESIIKNFNPFRLNDLQILLEMRCFKGLLTDDDIKDVFRRVWGFRDRDFMLQWWRLSGNELDEKLDSVPPSIVDIITDNRKSMAQKRKELRFLQYIPMDVAGVAMCGVEALKAVNEIRDSRIGGRRRKKRRDPKISFCLACVAGLEPAMIVGLANVDGGRSKEEIDEGARFAAKYGHVDIVDLLVHRYNATIDESCLMEVVQGRQTDMFDHLVDRFSLHPNSRMAAHYVDEAARAGSAIMVAHLLDKFDFDDDDAHAEGSPVNRAAEAGHADVLRAMIDHGMTANIETLLGACYYGQLDAMRWVLTSTCMRPLFARPDSRPLTRAVRSFVRQVPDR